MSEFTDSDYEALEAAVMETPRGRWFLGEYARRARAADTQVLLGAIRKLERGMAGLNVPGGSADVVNEVDDASQALAAAIADAAALQYDLATPDAAESSSGAVETTRLGRDLAELAGALQGFAEGLSPAESESLDPTVLQESAGELSRLSLLQDAVSQRAGELKQQLVQIKARLDALIGAERPRAGSDLTAENLSYFGGDEDLFESGSESGAPATAAAPSLSLVGSGLQDEPGQPASPPAEGVAVAAEASANKERVVIVRHASSEQTSIPLADEPGEELPDSRPAHGG